MTSAIKQAEALLAAHEVLLHEYGRFKQRNKPGTPFDGGVTAAQSDVIRTVGLAAPALKLLLDVVKCAGQAQETLGHFNEARGEFARTGDERLRTASVLCGERYQRAATALDAALSACQSDALLSP